MFNWDEKIKRNNSRDENALLQRKLNKFVEFLYEAWENNKRINSLEKTVFNLMFLLLKETTLNF